MYELTEESRDQIFEFLEAHPDSGTWDALIRWLRDVSRVPYAAAGYELPTGALYAQVPGAEISVIYEVVDEPQPIIAILRID